MSCPVMAVGRCCRLAAEDEDGSVCTKPRGEMESNSSSIAY